MQLNLIPPVGSTFGASDRPFVVGQPRGPSFGQQIESYVNQVNNMQNQADQAVNKLALGDVRSLHSVMIASEQASIALSAVLQVRNKALDAYQEVMRMQV